jgi:hypothetical protein
MTQLERAIETTKRNLKDKTLSSDQKQILETMLKNYESQQSLRNLSPQPFYKEEF